MTNDDAIKVLQVEMACVKRSCVRHECAVCDLVMCEKDVLASYQMAITALQTDENCDDCKHGYFGDEKCDNCCVRYPNHYERRTDERLDKQTGGD